MTSYASTIMGLGQFSNGDVALVGGLRVAGAGTDGTARLRYALYDAARVGRGEDPRACEFGECEVNVVPAEADADWRVEGIVSLEVRRSLRGAGLGARAVRCIAGACDGDLAVYDVRASAAGFWEGLGFDLGTRRRGSRLDGSVPVSRLLGDGSASVRP